MLQWACASVGAILVTINPAYRINELVSVFRTHASEEYIFKLTLTHSPLTQIQTLSAVGVKHLICVPRIRSSAYLAMLADAAPGIRNSPPGEISDPRLPELRNIIVMDNGGEYRAEVEKLEIRSLVDWREILLWREDTREEKARRVLEGSMGKDDVINLQFTR